LAEMHPLNLIGVMPAKRTDMKRWTLGLVALLTLPVISLSACQEAPAPQETVSVAQKQLPLEVFLVRHAEKTKAESDPDLTEAGAARASLLADMLIDAGVMHIHSSDTVRTRDTAAPLAKRLGLEVELYDPRDLPAMAAQLKSAGGRHLVVGHSNTTDKLTELLGGEGGAPIVEATEYNRLYFGASDGSATSTLLRFGE